MCVKQGIVTAAESAAGKSVWTYGVLQYSELLAEGPSLWRDRYRMDRVPQSWLIVQQRALCMRV